MSHMFEEEEAPRKFKPKAWTKEKVLFKALHRRVIEAIRAVQAANKEVTTHNIAAQMKLKVPTVGARLQVMFKAGLVRRHGMVLQFDGKNRAKNMLWRVNTLNVRKLEAKEKQRKEKK